MRQAAAWIQLLEEDAADNIMPCLGLQAHFGGLRAWQVCRTCAGNSLLRSPRETGTPGLTSLRKIMKRITAFTSSSSSCNGYTQGRRQEQLAAGMSVYLVAAASFAVAARHDCAGCDEGRRVIPTSTGLLSGTQPG